MPAHNSYFPLRRGDQIIWLKNYRQKIANYQTAGGYSAAEIAAALADVDFCIQLLETWLSYVAAFGEGASAYVRLILNGPIATAIVPLI